MSRHRKGRRHRTVNMTPRPVGRAGAPRAVPPATAGREEVAAGRVTSPAGREQRAAGRGEPAAGRAEARAGSETARRADEGVSTPAHAPLPGQSQPLPGQSQGDEEYPAVLRRVRESGLSRHAVSTWEQLASAGVKGSALDELCAAVGFQEATVLRHLKGLADQGLVVREEDRWRATGAGGEPGAPERDGAAEPAVS